MKRFIPFGLAGVLAGLLWLSGCEEKNCDPCTTTTQEPCCEPSGGTVTQGTARPMAEHRTEVGRPATRPAR